MASRFREAAALRGELRSLRGIEACCGTERPVSNGLSMDINVCLADAKASDRVDRRAIGDVSVEPCCVRRSALSLFC